MKKELLKTGLLIGIQEALEQEESKGNDMPLNDKARTEQEPNLAKFKSGNNEYFSEAMGPLRYSAAEHKRLETIAAHVTGKSEETKTEQKPNLSKFKSGNNEYFSEAMGPLRYSAAEHKRLETIAAHVTGKSEETKTNDQKAQDIIAKLTGRNKPATTTVPKSRL